MVTFSHLNQLRPFTILLLGDFLLDRYTLGRAHRISPEAPVPIVHHQQSFDLPGGAGNVLCNLLSLNATVVPVGRIGKDPEAASLLHLLRQEGQGAIDLTLFLEDPLYPTPLKHRIVADEQQLLRIDREEYLPLRDSQAEEVVARMTPLLEKSDLLLISDYGKGWTTPFFLKKVIQKARQRNLPIIVDPKGSDFTKYRGATIIKPNYQEALTVTQKNRDSSIEEIGEALLAIDPEATYVITRGGEGISLIRKGVPSAHFPTQKRTIKDVTGAGDTVLALLASCIANDLPLETALPLCNLAGGLAVQAMGCYRITLADLAEQLLEEKKRDLYFGQEEIPTLSLLLRKKRFSLLQLKNGHKLQLHHHEALSRFAAVSPPLLLWVEEEEPSRELLSLLSSLREVRYLVSAKIDEAQFLTLFQPEAIATMDEEGIRVQKPSL